MTDSHDIDVLATALQDAWNDFCADSGNHPDCLYRGGGKLYADFRRGNFVRMVVGALERDGYAIFRDAGVEP